MHTLYASFLLFSFFILTFFCLSLIIKDKLFVSETVFSFLFGLLLKKTEFIKIDNLENILFHFSRILMSLQVVAVGLFVPKKYMKRESKSIFYFLIPIMFLSYGISTGIIYLVGQYFSISFLNIFNSMIIGACITPTDPVLASVILKGKFANKYIPAHLRNLLMVESGMNDGLGWPMLALPIFLMKKEEFNTFSYNFFVKTILYEVVLSVPLGILIGFVFKKIYIFVKKNKLIDKESNLAFLLILTTFSIGLNVFIQIDDILCLFVIGLSFTHNNIYLDEMKSMHLLEVIDLLFTLTFFILFGLNIEYKIFSVPNMLIGFLIILFRRLPLVLMFYKFIPQLFSLKEALLTGWFGPIGVGAIFFALEAQHKENLKSDIFDVIQVIVVFSLIVHGITAPFVNLSMKRKREKLIDEEESGGCESDYTDDVLHKTDFDITFA